VRQAQTSTLPAACHCSPRPPAQTVPRAAHASSLQAALTCDWASQMNSTGWALEKVELEEDLARYKDAFRSEQGRCGLLEATLRRERTTWGQERCNLRYQWCGRGQWGEVPVFDGLSEGKQVCMHIHPEDLSGGDGVHLKMSTQDSWEDGPLSPVQPTARSSTYLQCKGAVDLGPMVGSPTKQRVTPGWMEVPA